MNSNPEVGRFHLLLTLDGQPAQHGWWGDEATARDKHREWIGVWGRPGARIALVDEETGETLAEWPEEE
ncbi:hypothetical protein ACFWPQ_01510 [Streptomyces sp. NPDC058464]|uniref:hypothetical protein n=1 Tax=Streptomyces sp. NPDC058464 TaxID=3346511 RepID=UPI003668AB15